MKQTVTAIILLTACAVCADTTYVPAGAVSGIWDSTGSPYIIQGNIYVAYLDTFKVLAGAKIIFNGNYSLSIEDFCVFGIMGSETDTILITSNDTATGFSGIRFSNVALPCTLKYFVLEHVNGNAIYTNHASIYIKNGIVRNCNRAIYTNHSNINIQESMFLNNTQAIRTYEPSNTICIKNSTFSDNVGDGPSVFYRDPDLWTDSGHDKMVIDSCEFTNNINTYVGAIIQTNSYMGSVCILISNSTFIGNSSAIYASICGDHDTLSLYNCRFDSNSSLDDTYGSGAALNLSQFDYVTPYVDIINCEFNNNTSASGGAICSSIPIYVDGCYFGENNSNIGGAINAGSSENVIKDSQFIGNSAMRYGGCYYGNGTFINCVFDSNSASVSGGTIYSSGMIELNSCQILNSNSGWYGGAVYLADCDATFKNCILKDLIAQWGGFLGSEDGEANIINCIICNSSAITAGGGFWFKIDSESKVNIFNTIFNFITAPSGPLAYDDGGNDTLKFIASYYDTTLGVDGSGLTIVREHFIPEEPTFVDTGDNPWELTLNSSGVDAGLHSYGSLTAPDDDILGRPRPSWDMVDIGPYEVMKISVIAIDSLTCEPVSGVVLKWREIGASEWDSIITDTTGELRFEADTTADYEFQFYREGYLCLPPDTSITGAQIPATIVVEVSHTPLAPEIYIPVSSINFGEVMMHTEAISQILIKNIGTADLYIYSLEPHLSQFSVGTYPSSIAPNGSSYVDVFFLPDSNINFDDTMLVYSNDDTVAVVLHGMGLRPATLWHSVNSIDFGNVPIGTFQLEYLQIGNIGDVDLYVDTMYAVPSHFSLESPYSSILEPGEDETAIVSFIPTLATSYTGTLFIECDDTTGIVLLSGEGTSGIFDSKTPSIWSLEIVPNPFNSSLSITYNIANASDVSLEIYDVLGQKLVTLINKRKSAGTYTTTWTAPNDIPSGIYFVRLKAGDQTITKRAILIR